MRVGGARPPPFITFTITRKVAVYAPAEWALGRYTNPVSTLVKICTLWVGPLLLFSIFVMRTDLNVWGAWWRAGGGRLAAAQARRWRHPPGTACYLTIQQENSHTHMEQISIETPNPKCWLYWCLIEFIDSSTVSQVGIYNPSCEVVPSNLLTCARATHNTST